MRLFLIVLLAAGLCSCGQKGPLQRPNQTALQSGTAAAIHTIHTVVG
jgi:predicted small lipoprotein YifL